MSTAEAAQVTVPAPTVPDDPVDKLTLWPVVVVMESALSRLMLSKITLAIPVVAFVKEDRSTAASVAMPRNCKTSTLVIAVDKLLVNRAGVIAPYNFNVSVPPSPLIWSATLIVAVVVKSPIIVSLPVVYVAVSTPVVSVR